MGEVRASKSVTPICYIEGVRYNVLAAQVSCVKNENVRIMVIIPYDPNAFPGVIEVETAEETVKHENGLDIVYDVTIRGITENTVVELHEGDYETGLERLVVQGTVTHVKKIINDQWGTVISIGAQGPSYFMSRLTAQMADLGKALQVKEKWTDMFGVSSVSSIATKIKAEGLRKGILAMLDDAGNNTDVFSNLIWRLFRIFHRIQIIDNPKALGGFGSARMGTIIDKALSKIKSDAPLILTIKKILELVDYHMIPVALPCFLNATYGEDGHVTVDTENEFVDIGLDPKGGPAEHLKTNEILYIPSIFLSPPARPNVIFPSQYKEIIVEQDAAMNCSRGIVNVTGRAQLNGGTSSDALILPEKVASGITADGKYYIHPIERATGIKWSSFYQGRPEAVEELKGDFMKGYMENLYAKTQFMGYKISLTECTYNPKPIVGLPTLILSSDGRHWIAELDALQLDFQKDTPLTSYAFGLCRPYDVEVPSGPGNFWFEHDMFAQDNIGSYIYPRIIGVLNELNSAGIVPEDMPGDMSIMPHLFNSEEELTTEEMEEMAEKPDAPKKAIDNLFKMWRDSEFKGWFNKYYGARKGITREQWYTDFLKCQHSDDWFIVGNGYTLATNSVTIPAQESPPVELTDEGMEDPEAGVLPEAQEQSYGDEVLPLDQEFSGCYVKERQEAVLPLAIAAIGAISVPAQTSRMLAQVLEAIAENDAETEDIEEMMQDE